MSCKTFSKSSRLAVILGLAVVMALAIGATALGQPGQGSCCYTAPGQFRFPTNAIIQAQTSLGPVQFRLMGPTMVRTLPNPPPVIPTEMLALELHGASPFGGGVGLHLTPGTTSMGQTSGPNSFFDVFTEISFDNAPWAGGQPDDVYTGMPGNQYIPVRVTNGDLQCIPPQPGATWTTAPGTSIPLTSRRLNAQIGVITVVTHTVIDPGHYKTWRITDFSPPQFRTVIAKDQFMTDNLTLDSAVYLSNPVQKCTPLRCFNVADTTEHFMWYGARGRDTLLDVTFENQFQQTTLRIDKVEYFLLPARKFPHNPPKLLDHYKAYRIRNPQPFTTQIQLRDQFDLTPEVINTLIPRYFLTPAQKTFGPVPDPIFDTLTHFVAYEIFPKRLSTQNRDVEDQFSIPNVHPVRIDSSFFLLVPTCKLRATPPPEEEACCYKDPLGNQICALVPVGECAALGGTVVAACLGDGNGNGIDDACEPPPTENCCYTGPGGSPICGPVPVGECAALGGTVVAACLGDGNGNGIDDACEPPPTENCCYTGPGGSPICGPVPVGECAALGGTVVAACLGDGNGNGIDDACEEPPPQGINHYKTWRVTPQELVVSRTVSVRDQFMLDANVRLDSIHYLSNPTRKITFTPTGSDTFNVVDTTDHLTWYRATGKSLLKGLQVVFRNQFQQDTVRVDQVRYLLVPTQKFPHLPPDKLDHYKAYRIRKPERLQLPLELQDQFDLQDPRGPEFINSLVQRYFLTPAEKTVPGQQPSPRYDSVTHYVAYEIDPKRPVSLIRDLADQFGVHVVRVDSSVLLLVPTEKLAVCRKPVGDLNGSGDLTAADIALQLLCVFTGNGDCDLCFTDVNDSGGLSASDVAVELLAVFLGIDFP